MPPDIRSRVFWNHFSRQISRFPFLEPFKVSFWYSTYSIIKMQISARLNKQCHYDVELGLSVDAGWILERKTPSLEAEILENDRDITFIFHSGLTTWFYLNFSIQSLRWSGNLLWVTCTVSFPSCSVLRFGRWLHYRCFFLQCNVKKKLWIKKMGRILSVLDGTFFTSP